ncbi:deoxyguanosinetriphosphate triphosphohydrolase [Thermus thermamylovorans]|uniref:Deoxyguanosinetriphosphate triphosphohydrolase-like protein n=1 Tax=Thermus thermamylovorans TaxID=2509362 RepID=A0A4Q9B5Q4_9DEIN|nr:deoxyguanosinetriphosphate triphosphohydrolase [Thermus thermamylovorans]TBH21360.1 deoxyguanosinetriphosphate triphosphohydrolase [Thermus thermamylovorans]
MLFPRERLLELEAERLAPYAQRARDTRGREHPEAEPAYRTPYQKDRDRILHTTAFRRLEYKTQVFPIFTYRGEGPIYGGDYYRTRLTHTLEVAQVSRSIARALGLNEDLTEAIALSHDLGHPPFGHTGEKVLHGLMENHGGFEHNAQALRILTRLEVRYPGFRGLNLTHEVLEGIATHEAAYAPHFKPGYEGKGTLEAQVVDLSDAIAYAAHDLDDGLRSGLLRPEGLVEVPLLRDLAREEGLDFLRFSELSRRVLVRQLLGYLIAAAIGATHAQVAAAGVQSAESVRRHPERLASLTPEAEKALHELKAFLMERLYRHPEVLRERRKAEAVLEGLFAAYTRYPEILPKEVQAQIPEEGLYRAVCDYVAGMTDRYALEAYRRLFP